MRQGVRLRHVRLSPRDARVTTPKYRTDTRACSCLGYWWRRSCNHFRAYREAVALVLAQDTCQQRVVTGTGQSVQYRCFASITQRDHVGPYR